jgi:hypothetical protein
MVQNMEQDKGTTNSPSHLPAVSPHALSPPGAIVTSRNIALADLLHHCSHHATAMRADAMRGILEIIQARPSLSLSKFMKHTVVWFCNAPQSHPSVLQSHGCQVSDAVCACLADLSREVRHTALLPLQHILRLAGPSSSALMADCACTHVGRGLCDTASAVRTAADLRYLPLLGIVCVVIIIILIIMITIIIVITAATSTILTVIRYKMMHSQRPR